MVRAFRLASVANPVDSPADRPGLELGTHIADPLACRKLSEYPGGTASEPSKKVAFRGRKGFERSNLTCPQPLACYRRRELRAEDRDRRTPVVPPLPIRGMSARCWGDYQDNTSTEITMLIELDTSSSIEPCACPSLHLL